MGNVLLYLPQADNFHRHGRELRRKMWLQNLRFKLMVGGGIAALILILWLMICGGFKC
jgi:vesicle-associated membrane protein 72